MDEELMSRRPRKPSKKLPRISHEILAEAERPAMVEVSLPNVPREDEHDLRKEKNQRLFSLVSEGSEILNIIAPPRVSTVDEEESKGLEDNLCYLEETPALKSADKPEPDFETVKTENRVLLTQIPFPSIQVSRRGQMSEDYFENFIDHRETSGAESVEEAQRETEDKVTEEEEEGDRAVHPEAETRLSGVSLVGSMLDISGEHLDDVFYGGGSEPPTSSSVGEKQRELSKSSLKESGSVLFGSEDPVLTPVYLPEGPPKIIDPSLLEEPKALAFLYSDLYADAVGTRMKRDDDAESVTSEKSFHSQASDSEDRGYLEKFVLKVETQADVVPEIRLEERHDPFRLAGYVEVHKEDVDDQVEEITDFFRNSASSSPCEPVDFENEEKSEVVRTPRVTFKDEEPRNKTVRPSLADDVSEEFLPVEISEDCPAWEENLSTDSDPRQNTKSVGEKTCPTPIQAQNNTVRHHKPFLDLIPLLPIQTENETETPDAEEEKENTSSAGVSNQDCVISGDSRENPTNLLHEDGAEAPADHEWSVSIYGRPSTAQKTSRMLLGVCREQFGG